MERGFPGGVSGKEPSCQCRRHKRWGFDPWVKKILWRRKWQPTPVFLPWRIPWTEEPGGLQSMVLQSQTRLKPLGMHTRTYYSGAKYYCSKNTFVLERKKWRLPSDLILKLLKVHIIDIIKYNCINSNRIKNI